MEPDADAPDPRYSAFISYSRADSTAAHRIHRTLEAYRLPSRLHPTTGAWNATTRRLKPLFRDLDEMTVAPDINSAVNDAIRQSAFLVVLCSPRSAKSDWVGREIAMFRAAHGDASILAALIDGTPETAFHPDLLHADGTGALLQPLAADFRPRGDGLRLGVLKLVAVMAGVGLGDLVQRDAQRRLRQLAIAAAAALLVIAIVAALAITALRSREDAARQSARAGAMSGYMLDQMRSNLKRYGNVGMLAEVNRGVMESFRGRDLAGLNDDEKQQLAKLRLALGDDAQQRGDLAEAQTQIAEASRITATRLAAAPSDPQRIYDHAQSEYFVAIIDWQTGDLAGARAGFDEYRDLARQLVAIDSKNPRWWMEACYAEQGLGSYILRTTLDTVRAEARFDAALASCETAARLRPNDPDTLATITDLHAWLGDARRLRGDYAGALASRTTQRRLLEARRAADPRDRVVQGDLVTNDLAMARIAAAQEQWAMALAALDRGRAAAVALAQADPDNVRRASQVRIFDLFRLRTWLAMPKAARPAAARLAAANGDCMDDKKRLKSEELAEFCMILQSRRRGDPMPPASSVTANALSQRWGLDFAKERALPTGA